MSTRALVPSKPEEYYKLGKPEVGPIINAGGIFAYARQTSMISGSGSSG